MTQIQVQLTTVQSVTYVHWTILYFNHFIFSVFFFLTQQHIPVALGQSAFFFIDFYLEMHSKRISKKALFTISPIWPFSPIGPLSPFFPRLPHDPSWPDKPCGPTSPYHRHRHNNNNKCWSLNITSASTVSQHWADLLSFRSRITGFARNTYITLQM